MGGKRKVLVDHILKTIVSYNARVFLQHCSLCVFYKDFSLWNIFIFILGPFSLKILCFLSKKFFLSQFSPQVLREKRKKIIRQYGRREKGFSWSYFGS